jgi:Asp-tRNA(Asn)/Glu-tRNA(Gln) amidotransferase A subunit family amidase
MLGRALRRDDVEPMTWSVVELAGQYSAEDYTNGLAVLHRVGRELGRFFSGHDILLMPTMITTPLPLGVVSPENSDVDSYLLGINRCIAFTSVFNSAGCPAMSVPLHWTAAGLPVGVQFAAPFGDEATLFRLAAQLEAARPWKDRLPPLLG